MAGVPIPKRPVKLTDAELLIAKSKLREKLCNAALDHIIVRTV